MINWIKKILNTNTKSDWKVINNNGQKTVISPEVMNHFNSNLPNPDPADLKKLIDKTVKIIVLERIIEIGRDELQFLLEINNKEKIKITGQNLEIESKPQGHLLDSGYFIFDFFMENDEKYRIEFLGAGLIRWKKKWKEDAKLKNPLVFLEWLSGLGIEKPLKKHNESIKKEKKRSKQFNQWKEKAPKSVIRSIDSDYCYDYDKVQQELKKEISEERDLILKLFELFGSDFGNWSGFPSYEIIPEGVLLKIPIKSFNEIYKSSELTKEQMHGMARFFSGWDFNKNRKTEINKLSIDLKKLLLEHLMEFGDLEKINQFEKRVINKNTPNNM